MSVSPESQLDSIMLKFRRPVVHVRLGDDGDVRVGSDLLVPVLVLLDAQLQEHLLQGRQAVDVQKPGLNYFLFKLAP